MFHRRGLVNGSMWKRLGWGALGASAVFFCVGAHAGVLSNGDPLSLREAAILGRYVDHPTRIVPPEASCNAAAELEMRVLQERGYQPYYLVSVVVRGGQDGWVTHVAVAQDFPAQHETVVWDQLKGEQPWTADALAADGYTFVGREIDGRWYSVREQP